ncbi:MAG TPA: addiction module protein [Thermoanaerobaculia bacterium]|nr:addiction module protein [Thermoanaerobaculia bacterium]
MATLENPDEIFRAALSLPQDVRADLADRLRESLGEVAAVDERWAHEAEDRILAYERGEIAAVPGDRVLAALRSRRG